VKVHPDCHVVIAGSFYSGAFPICRPGIGCPRERELCGDLPGAGIGGDPPAQPHKWTMAYRMEDYPPAKAAYLIRTPDYCRKLAAKIGPATQGVVEQLLNDRPLIGCARAGHPRLEESVGPNAWRQLVPAPPFRGYPLPADQEYPECALDREPLPETLPSQRPQPPVRPPWRRIFGRPS